jgi:hypothetical protein
MRGSAQVRATGNRKMDEISVRSWNELNEHLFHAAWKDSLQRFRSHYAYRGSSVSSADLKSGLAKLGGKHQEVEAHLLRNFRKYAHRDAVPIDSIWNWLALAQHHGLPTRLMDWTYSPYVALHFATSDRDTFAEDSVVWSIDYVKTNEFLPQKLKQLLTEEGAYAFTAEMLERVVKNLSQLQQLDPNDFVIFFEPPSLDERITNQFALFSLMSSTKSDLEAWVEQHPGTIRKLLIPASLKREIRDKLDQANITERVLFPGLDGLSAWLARYYSSK